jgi:hypothetical protein
MSQQTTIFTITRVAAGAIAAKRFVDYAGAQAGAAVKTLGVNDYAIGAAGEAASIRVLGTAIVETGGAFADGAPIKTDATGRAVDQAGAGQIVARALQASGGAGQFVEVLILPAL